MKRTMKNPLTAPSNRIRCVVLLPELPSEIWTLILSFARSRIQRAFALSAISKALRASFFASVERAVVGEDGTYGGPGNARARDLSILGSPSCASVARFTNLVRLDLRWIPQDGSANLSDYVSGLSNLQRLRCSSFVRFASGSVPNPSKILDLSIETANRGFSMKTGIRDDHVLGLTNLSALKIDEIRGDFTGSCFSVLTNISKLELRFVPGVSPIHFANLRNLSSLTVRSGRIRLLEEISRHENVAVSLRELNFNNNNRPSDAMCSLNALTNLTTLKLSGCIGSCEQVSNLARLRTLALDGKGFEAFFGLPGSARTSGPPGLQKLKLRNVPGANLSGLTGLTELRLLRGATIEEGCARNLKALRALECCDCEMRDEDLAEMTSLRYLNLAFSDSLSDESVSRLANLAKLKVERCPKITKKCLASALTNSVKGYVNGRRLGQQQTNGRTDERGHDIT